MNQRSKEIQIEIDNANRELQENKDQLAKYDWVKVRRPTTSSLYPSIHALSYLTYYLQWWPLPPGLGLLIKTIVESITQNEKRIKELEGQMSDLRSAQFQLEMARMYEDQCLDTVVQLTKSWSDLTQEASDLAALLKIIADVPDTAGALAEDAKKTWVALNSELARW